jgi:hypothetical protein
MLRDVASSQQLEPRESSYQEAVRVRLVRRSHRQRVDDEWHASGPISRTGNPHKK